MPADKACELHYCRHVLSERCPEKIKLSPRMQSFRACRCLLKSILLSVFGHGGAKSVRFFFFHPMVYISTVLESSRCACPFEPRDDYVILKVHPKLTRFRRPYLHDFLYQYVIVGGLQCLQRSTRPKFEKIVDIYTHWPFQLMHKSLPDATFDCRAPAKWSV